MKTLISVLALILTASTAMAEAPCQNPVAQTCQKACAVMGAKYILLMHERMSVTGTRAQTVRVDSSQPLANAQHLAQLAGLSLDYIDGLTMRQIDAAIAGYCPR